MTTAEEIDYAREIAEIVASMPQVRRVQLYEFALFLKSHPLPTEESFAEVIADEAIWDAQFAASDDDKLAALVATVEEEIARGETLPMFDERGDLIEPR